jgi:hypothetical protein
MTDTIDTSKVAVRPISKSVAKQLVEKFHYSHQLNSCKYALGVFYKGKQHTFFDSDEELIGCITFGNPVGPNVTKSICPEHVEQGEIIELTRLWIKDFEGDKNIESYVVAQSFRWLRANAPEIKVVISYADPEHDHTGAIYQATNWIYQGIGPSSMVKFVPNFRIKLKENGEWMHTRTIGERYPCKRTPEELRKYIGHPIWVKEDPLKHRYLFILADKRTKKKILKEMKFSPVPYPKESSIQDFQEYLVP